MAIQLRRRQRVDEAAFAYRRAIDQDTDNAGALHLLGAVCLQTGRHEEAAALLRRATSLRPDFPEALNNLGVALEAAGALPDAEAAYRAAIRLRPDFIDGRNNLGNTLRRLGRVEEAGRQHERALRLRPGHAVTHNCLGATALERADLDAALKHYWRAASLKPTDAAAHSDLLFWLLHHPRYSDQQIFEAHLKWAKRHAGGGKSEARSTKLETNPKDQNSKHKTQDDRLVLSSSNSELVSDFEIRASDLPLPGRPLRVGYVSPDFREHTVARFFEPLLANHDRDVVTSVCYSDVARPDAVTHRLKGLAGEWRDTAGMGDAALANQVRADGIDILVDLTGHMGGGRLLVFARKPAPVQVTYLGYPHSTGLAAIDYRITDAASDPVGMTERYHVETLVRLEGCAWCYRPDEDAPEIDEPPAVRNGYVTFGAFNRTAKLTRPVAELWAKVVDAVPGSRLTVLAAGGENNASVRRLVESAGVPGGRLTLVPSGDRRSYLGLCRQADVGLDPFPYNGMTTTCDLLWLGVPTVTLAGTSHRGRVGASLMGAVGLDRCVAADEAGYVAAAAGLAADLAALRAIRLGLRDRMAASPLRDAVGLARRIEAAYAAMSRRRERVSPRS